jgi:hypothetical protein
MELLENCLFSVQRAMQDIDGEIIIIDNNSKDGIKEYLPSKFPGSKIYF